MTTHNAHQGPEWLRSACYADERTSSASLAQQTANVANDPPRTKRFEVLPKLIKVEDTIASHEVRDAPDPEAGRDTDRDFLLRHN